jgi:hypothetical protein
VRFTHLVFKKTRQAATPKKLKSAERRLKQERDKYPLLVDWIVEQQPTAQERVDTHLDDWQRWCQSNRASTARQWRENRQLLRNLPAEDKARFLEYWNNSRIPGDASYFRDALRRFMSGKIDI